MSPRGPASPEGAFERTVTALVDSIVRARVPDESTRTGDLARLVLAQHARMPAHLRAGVRLATIGFDWSAILRGGRPFHATGASGRHEWLARWRRARFGPCRDLIRFWESLVVYGCFAAAEPDGR